MVTTDERDGECGGKLRGVWGGGYKHGAGKVGGNGGRDRNVEEVGKNEG